MTKQALWRHLTLFPNVIAALSSLVIEARTITFIHMHNNIHMDKYYEKSDS